MFLRLPKELASGWYVVCALNVVPHFYSHLYLYLFLYLYPIIICCHCSLYACWKCCSSSLFTFVFVACCYSILYSSKRFHVITPHRNHIPLHHFLFTPFHIRNPDGQIPKDGLKTETRLKDLEKTDWDKKFNQFQAASVLPFTAVLRHCPFYSDVIKTFVKVPSNCHCYASLTKLNDIYYFQANIWANYHWWL